LTGKRLIAHFGVDLVVFEQEGVRNTAFSHWAGTHWDMIGGDDSAMRTAQKIGALIGLEADYLAALPHEADAIEAADDAAIECERMEPGRAIWMYGLPASRRARAPRSPDMEDYD
jgi:putative DNA primase/helicase